MEEVLTAIIAAGVVVLLVMGGVVAVGGLLHWTKQRSSGYFSLFPYLTLLAYALLVFSAGRDFTVSTGALDPIAPRSPLVATVQMMVSIMLVMAAGERVLNFAVSARQRTGAPVVVLTVAFTLYWFCTVAVTAFLGAHPQASHDMLYPPLFGVAAMLMSEEDAESALRRARNALLWFMGAGWILLGLVPNMAADFHYTQGFLPGVPRFAGFAAHAVSLGMLAQIALLCLWARPIQSLWLNRLCWGMGLLTLFLAQSKTAWMSFTVCALAMAWVRGSAGIGRAIQSPKNQSTMVVGLGLAILGLFGVGIQLTFGNVAGKLQRFFDSAEGAQLTSLTGRDQIWAVTWQEWERSPVFGYGLSMFDLNHRMQVGISAATHAHNQFMDTLGRSGMVGAAALTIYAIALLYYSVRFAKASYGLSVALFLALALRAISEVPLTVSGYGPEFLPHLLLLVVLAGCARGTRLEPHRQLKTEQMLNPSAHLAPRPLP